MFLWIIPGFVSPANGAIEIYANGHKYNSLQEYALWKESVNNPKGKSFQASQKNLSDETLRKLYALSIENAMAGVLRNFYQTWEPSESLISRTVMLGTPATRDITPEQLQKAIEQSVTVSKDPKLLISGQGKVRIMAISPDNPGH